MGSITSFLNWIFECMLITTDSDYIIIIDYCDFPGSHTGPNVGANNKYHLHI